MVTDFLDHRPVIEPVGVNAVVADGDVVIPQQRVQPLHGKVTRAVVIGVLVVAENEHGMLPPAKRLLDLHPELAQLFVGGARVGDRCVMLEANGAGAGRNHGNVPVGGEAGDGGRGVIAARADEGPGVAGLLEIDGHQGRYGVGAEALVVLRAAVDQPELQARQQPGVRVHPPHCLVQCRRHTRPCPRIVRIRQGQDGGQSHHCNVSCGVVCTGRRLRRLDQEDEDRQESAGQLGKHV